MTYVIDQVNLERLAAAVAGPVLAPGDEGYEPETASWNMSLDIYHRLVDVKREYDPGNMFRVNHNISPGQ
ncbi:MAG TPA: BBE domain-containing protein [Asanoa sp.]|nr:BBE domain-containing protein [Asanoa sp.]